MMLDDEAALLIVARYTRETQPRVHVEVAASQLSEDFKGIAANHDQSDLAQEFKVKMLVARAPR